MNLQFTDRFIELKMGCRENHHLDLWIVRAMKTAWRVWSHLGWDESKMLNIRQANWSSFACGNDRDLVMNEILRFNYVMSKHRQLTEREFEDGWINILHITALLHEKQIFLGKTPEADKFRKEVARFISFCISKGCDITKPNVSTFFVEVTEGKLNDTAMVFMKEANIMSQVHSSVFNVIISDVDQPLFYVTNFACSYLVY